MPRRSRRDAVAERVEARSAEQQERRREAAHRGAQTRRQRRQQQQAEAQPQPRAESRTQRHVTRRSRQRTHPDMVTIAVRGPLAAKMRQLAESTGMSLAKLLGDMVLVYDERGQGGYEPGASLARWRERQGDAEVG